MAQWIRPWTLNREVPGSNLLAAACSSALGQGTLSSLPSPSEILKAVGPLFSREGGGGHFHIEGVGDVPLDRVLKQGV